MLVHLYFFFSVRAGPPEDLLERDITDTTVNLTWYPPSYLGIPELSFYQILVSPPPPSDANLFTAITSLLVHSLTPGTQYNITVVGVSTGENFDTLEGEKSNLISFKTATRGRPYMYTFRLFDTCTCNSQPLQLTVSLLCPEMVQYLLSGLSSTLVD